MTSDESVSQTNNWNPFSTKPALDAPAFAVTIGALSCVNWAIGVFVQSPIRVARLSLDLKSLVIWYGVWFIASLLGFFLISNAFIKRWSTIWKTAETSPRWARTLSRVLLTSPLLSVWGTVFTCLFSREGTVFKENEKKSVIALSALGTLILFHIGFLGYRLVDNKIAMRQGVFVLKSEISARESLRKVAPSVREEFWLPGSIFQIHVYPYLSPITKLALSLYSDFVRSHALETAVEQKPELLCDDVPLYLGQKVENCFLTRYRQMGAERAFVSPATGLIFETAYRKQQGPLTPSSPMDAFAKSAITVENLIGLIEPGELVYDRQHFLEPKGFLAFFGSPEVVAIAAGQDTQRLALAKRLVPMIQPQIAKLAEALSGMQGALSPEDEVRANGALTSMKERVHDLSQDPLTTRRDVRR